MAEVIVTKDQADLIKCGSSLHNDEEVWYYLPFIWKVNKNGTVEQIHIKDAPGKVVNYLLNNVVVDKTKWDIWSEGYNATGQSSKAICIATDIEAKSFDEAVLKYRRENPEVGIQANTRKSYIDEEAYLNRDSNWNIWNCNLYDNEVDARKSFG